MEKLMVVPSQNHHYAVCCLTTGTFRVDAGKHGRLLCAIAVDAYKLTGFMPELPKTF